MSKDAFPVGKHAARTRMGGVDQMPKKKAQEGIYSSLTPTDPFKRRPSCVKPLSGGAIRLKGEQRMRIVR